MLLCSYSVASSRVAQSGARLHDQWTQYGRRVVASVARDLLVPAYMSTLGCRFAHSALGMCRSIDVHVGTRSAVSDPGCWMPPDELTMQFHDIGTRGCLCLDVKHATPVVTLDVSACHVGSALASMNHDHCIILLVTVNRLEHSASGSLRLWLIEAFFDEAHSV